MTAPIIAFAMSDPSLRDALFAEEAQTALARLMPVDPHVLTEFASAASRDVLARTEVLITSWGCPRMDAEVLDAAPRLRLVAHAAGSVKAHIDEAVLRRGITVTTAADANAAPVAQFTLASILFAGKRAFTQAHALRDQQGAFRGGVPVTDRSASVGNHRITVGIIGASRVGRQTLELLRRFDYRLLLADPLVSAAEAAALGAERVSLPDLMSQSTIVSLHAPDLPSTRGMIGAAELSRLRDGATFINTARGALVDHDALREQLVAGRISAILDVTDPEPLPTGDPLYALPNVLLTPHVAGAQGNELQLLGEAALVEVERHLAGQAAKHPVTLAALAHMA